MGFSWRNLKKHQHRKQKSLIPWGKKTPRSSGCSLESTLQMGPRKNFPSYLLNSVSSKTFPLFRAAEPGFLLHPHKREYLLHHLAKGRGNDTMSYVKVSLLPDSCRKYWERRELNPPCSTFQPIFLLEPDFGESWVRKSPEERGSKTGMCSKC